MDPANTLNVTSTSSGVVSVLPPVMWNSNGFSSSSLLKMRICPSHDPMASPNVTVKLSDSLGAITLASDSDTMNPAGVTT